MKYLLDTHVAKWSLDDTLKLSNTAKSIIGNTSLHLCLSVVSAWEIAIKVSIGKLNFTGGSVLFLEKLRQLGIEILSIDDSYIKLVETLPFIHRDPFDRLLVATAKAEGLIILTADENIRNYKVPSVW
jgi:PIN domain nuclease of toxin-antitoxin system